MSEGARSGTNRPMQPRWAVGVVPDDETVSEAPAPVDVPTISVPSWTLVTDRSGNHLFWFDGLFPLAIGARLRFNETPEFLTGEPAQGAGVDVVVVGVYVRATQRPVSCLVLEVEPMDPGAAKLSAVPGIGLVEGGVPGRD